MIKDFLKKNWIFYIFGFAFLAVNAVVQTMEPSALGKAVTLLEVASPDKNAVLRQAAIIALIGVAVFITRNIWRMLIIGTARRLDCWLREKLYAKYQHLPVSFYANRNSGDLMAYAINDINAVRMTFGPALAMSVSGIVTASVSIYGMITQIDPVLTLLALIPVPFTIVYTVITGNIIRNKFTKVQTLFSKLSGFVNESIAGIKIIKAFATEDERQKEFSEVSSDMRDANISLVKTSARVNPVIKAAFGLSYAIALTFGGQAVLDGKMGAGELVTFLGFLLLVQNPVVRLGDIINRLQRGLASYKRLESVYDEPCIADTEFEGTQTDEIVSGEDITVKELTFTYPSSPEPSLTGISLVIRSGSTVGIAGATGSGKTTLLTVLSKLAPAPASTVFYGSKDINSIPAADIRKDMGYVPQDGFLFSSTINENIAFCDEKPNEEKIRAAAEAACIDGKADMFSDGFGTEVGERGLHLSGGQKQRIALARALYRAPSLLLLDDTLSAVDTITEKRMIHNIKTLAESPLYKKKTKKPTVVIVSHKLSAIEDCDEIIYLDEGRIVERGTHKELMALGGLYAGMYALQHSEKKLEQDKQL